MSSRKHRLESPGRGGLYLSSATVTLESDCCVVIGTLGGNGGRVYIDLGRGGHGLTLNMDLDTLVDLGSIIDAFIGDEDAAANVAPVERPPAQ